MGASLPTDVTTDARLHGHFRLWGALAFYVLISIAATWPLARDASTLIAGDTGDPILNTSVLVWNATTFPHSPAYWNAPHFYPTQGATTFTENLLGMYQPPRSWSEVSDIVLVLGTRVRLRQRQSVSRHHRRVDDASGNGRLDLREAS